MIMSEADQCGGSNCYDDQNGPHFEWRNSYFDPRVIHLRLTVTVQAECRHELESATVRSKPLSIRSRGHAECFTECCGGSDGC